MWQPTIPAVACFESEELKLIGLFAEAQHQDGEVVDGIFVGCGSVKSTHHIISYIR